MFVNPVFNKFNHESNTLVVPSLLYGLTDTDSVLLTIPVVINQNVYQNKSRGLMDTSIQFEHEAYHFEDSKHNESLSVFFNVFVPTGSISKRPVTSDGGPHFFLGTSYNQTYIQWLWFATAGMFINPGHKIPSQDYQLIDIKTGNLYVTSLGGGYNFYSISDGMQLLGLFEFTSTVSDPSKVQGQTNPNSGGYVFLATPSIWFSTKRLIFQLGMTLPIDQAYNGFQNHLNYTLLANVGYTFYY